MFKFVGLFLLTISSLGFGLGNFSLEVCLFFLLGLFLVCSKEVFGHLLFIQREKVRAMYRSKR